MKAFIATILIFALAGQPLWASAPDRRHIDKVRKKVSQCLDDGRHVAIETYDNRKLAGTITQAAPDDFALTNAAGTTTLSYGEVKKVNAPMDPHKRSIIVSLAVLGGLFGTLLAAAANDK